MIVTRRVRSTMIMMLEKEGPSMMKRRMMVKRKSNYYTRKAGIMATGRTMISRGVSNHD
jgi:hypothetical protein